MRFVRRGRARQGLGRLGPALRFTGWPHGATISNGICPFEKGPPAPNAKERGSHGHGGRRKGAGPKRTTNKRRCVAHRGASTLGQFDSPSGIAMDSQNRIIVADTSRHRIQICDHQGICTAFGSFGTDPGQFDSPSGVAVDSQGQIIVADRANNRIQVCDNQGICTTFGDFGFITKCRLETLRTLGPSLSPFNSFLFLQGLETLHLRMERHVENAVAVAEHLHAHSAISWVKYAGLTDNPYHELAKKYLPKGAGSILTFGIKGGQQAGVKFIENAEMMSHLANVGDAKTLIIHPASTTHRQLNEEEQIAAGVMPDMIRISVGLESIDDILWDIDQALEKSQ